MPEVQNITFSALEFRLYAQMPRLQSYMETIMSLIELMDAIESNNFKCIAGPLKNSKQWGKLRTKLAEREWISCAEKLPDLNVKVICVKDRSKRSKHTIVEQDVRSLLSDHENHWMNTPRADKVTHWMPLPSAPINASPNEG